MQTTDGVLVVSAPAFDGKSIEAGRAWFAESGQDVWVVGPLKNAPPATTALVSRDETPGTVHKDAKVLGFLDEMKHKHGARSVIFVCHSYQRLE